MSGQPQFDDLVSRIANHYAGKQLGVTFDAPSGYLGQTYPGSDRITLAPPLRQGLEKLISGYKTDDGRRQGIQGLATLIHEALHTRGPARTDPQTGAGTLDPKTGFYSWDDEWQAHQLSYNLIADAMKRFFGVDPNSKLGQSYINAAQGYGYGGTLGGPAAAGAVGNLKDRTGSF